MVVKLEDVQSSNVIVAEALHGHADTSWCKNADDVWQAATKKFRLDTDAHIHITAKCASCYIVHDVDGRSTKTTTPFKLTHEHCDCTIVGDNRSSLHTDH